MKLETLAPLLLLALSACALPTARIEPRFGPVNVDGDVGISTGGATANNSTGDMGIEDDDGAFSLRGDFQWGSPHLSVALQQSAHDGDGTLSADLTQGGVTITQGSSVTTDFDLGLHSAYLTFDLIPGDWELGLGFGVVAIDLELETTDGTFTVSTDEVLPLPVLAARASTGLGPVDVEALVGFMTFDTGDEQVTFLDADVNGRVRIFGDGDRATGSLVLGLRHTQIDAEYEDGTEDVVADLTFSGPYLGFRMQF